MGDSRRQFCAVVAKRLPSICLPDADVPQPEFRADFAIAACRHLPDHQGIRAGSTAKSGVRGVWFTLAKLLGKGRRVEQLEKSRSFEIGHHHMRNIAAELRVIAQEQRHGDWDRRNRSLRLRDYQLARMRLSACAKAVNRLTATTANTWRAAAVRAANSHQAAVSSSAEVWVSRVGYYDLAAV